MNPNILYMFFIIHIISIVVKPMMRLTLNDVNVLTSLTSILNGIPWLFVKEIYVLEKNHVRYWYINQTQYCTNFFCTVYSSGDWFKDLNISEINSEYNLKSKFILKFTNDLIKIWNLLMNVRKKICKQIKFVKEHILQYHLMG